MSISTKHINAAIALPVMEDFYTIQGEGYHTGKAAYFIRLAGCDVGCHWCDVKESWKAEEHPILSISEIINRAEQQASRLAVITGGEPLMYNMDVLCAALHKKGFSIHIETSGAHPLTGKWDWICLSPKKFKAPRPEIIQKANELKIIIFNKSDFEWAEKYAEIVNKNCILTLQPEWSMRKKVSASIVEYVKQNPRWNISLQTHKYLQIP
ncbi:MAG: 7-carboxy-7-deazaguanine synthase QueE [Chitinophagales bacterium]